MKHYGFFIRNIFRLLLILALVRFVTYILEKPNIMLERLYFLPILFLLKHMFPSRWSKWKRSREVFNDNLSVFRTLEQLPLSYKARYMAGENASHANTQEEKLAQALLTYVQKKDYTDDAPYVKLQKRRSGKVILTVCCTWYEHHTFYMVPEERKQLFENFRFNKAVALSDSWYVLEGFRL